MRNFHKYSRILMPTDGSKCSIKASEHALWIANISDAVIIVLHVIDTYILQLGYSGYFKEDAYKMLRKEGEEVIERFKDKIEENKSKYPNDIKIITKIEMENPTMK